MSETSRPSLTGAPDGRVSVGGRAPVTVLGAGAWGTVLSLLVLHGAGGAAGRVRLWTRSPAHARALRAARDNTAYLPGVPLPAAIDVGSDLRAALEGARLALLAVPSRAVRPLVEALPETSPPLVVCAKGFEPGRFLRLSQVVHELRPELAVAVLSGPNLAAEIAAGKPAAATVASTSPTLREGVRALFDPARFRVYTSGDVAGVEVAGALKNVIALAAGMSDALGLGDNAKATIVTRGLAETVRLGVPMGGEERTFYGLAGLGDLVATCNSAQSRNHLAGVRLARGATRAQIEASGLTAEGIPTARAVHEAAARYRLELPISAEVYRVTYLGKDARDALQDLMTREGGPE